MTNGELQDVKMRVDAAVPGRWVTDEYRIWVGDSILVDGKAFEATSADLRFIAAARTDVPALLDEVKRLRDALSQVLGQQHVLKYTAKMISDWRDDPAWLKLENRIDSIDRFVRVTEEWHRTLVAAIER